MEEVFLSLGSNLGDKTANLKQALSLIESRIGEMKKVSSIFVSDAWGFEGLSFENLVVVCNTSLAPEDVLDSIHCIEEEMGRSRTKKGYENRLIDVDILYFGNWVVKSEQLTIPHPQIHKRNFVLQPMEEIAPLKIHPILLKTSEKMRKESSDNVVAKWLK